MKIKIRTFYTLSQGGRCSRWWIVGKGCETDKKLHFLILNIPTFPASVEVKIRLQLLPPVTTEEHEALPRHVMDRWEACRHHLVYMHSGDNDMLCQRSGGSCSLMSWTS